MTSAQTPPEKFRELDVLRDANGLKAVISMRTATGVITVALTREYPLRGGKDVGQTSFIPELLLGEAIDLLQRAQSRVHELRAGGQVPKARHIGSP